MISIIVPNYNSENTLNKCINSLLNIHDINYEIIVVDNGSTDFSWNIIKKYERNFDNIHVFYQKIKGVSAARNLGIKKANGEFISFLDSDDYINPISFSKLLKKIYYNYKGLIISNINKNNKSIGIKDAKEKSFTSKEFLTNFYPLYKNYIVHLLHGKIYCKKIIQKYNILFSKDMTVGEDLVFNLQYISKINQINQFNIKYYNYNINSKSVTKNYEPNILLNKIYIIHYLKQIYIKYNLSFSSIDKIKIQSNYAILLNVFRPNAPSNKIDYIANMKKLLNNYKLVPNNYKHKNIIYIILMLILKKFSIKAIYVVLIIMNKIKIMIGKE